MLRAVAFNVAVGIEIIIHPLNKYITQYAYIVTLYVSMLVWILWAYVYNIWPYFLLKSQLRI